MKKITQLLTALAFCSFMVFISCGGGDDDDDGTDPTNTPTDTEETTTDDEVGDLFAAITPKPTKVTNNGDDRDEWGDFEMTVTYDGESGGTITVTGVPEGAEDVWASGDYTFNTDQSSFTIDGGIERTITATASKVTVSFTVPSGSRVATFDGDWVFEW